MRLHEGDYVPDERGGFETVSGKDALGQRVLMKLKARRGAFPFMPTFGSRLWLLPREKASARQRAAEQYVSEALADEEEITVKDVTVSEREGELLVSVGLSMGGETFTVSLSI